MESRDRSLDILKGMGIILIIFAHSLGWKHILYPFIYSFHVPLFFVLSGYFYKLSNFRTQFNKDFRRLLIPYVVVTFVEIFLVFVHKLYLTGVFFGAYSLLWDSVTPIWFLVALFFCRLCFYFVLRLSKYYLLISFLISSFSWFLTAKFGLLIELNFSSSMGALFSSLLVTFLEKSLL